MHWQEEGVVPTVKTRVITTFNDPAVNPERWSELLSEGDTKVGALTWQSQRLWWLSREQSEALCLVIAMRDGRPQAIAPLFVAGGMAMNLCPINYLDFVGDVSDPKVLDAILETAREQVPDFVGFRFYYVPHTSRTGDLLRQAAGRLGLNCFLEDEQPSPIIDIRGKPEAALACTRKKTMLRREKALRREGDLEIQHFRKPSDVMPQLDEFFEQHVSRWADTPTPSRFRDAKQRESFRERTLEIAAAGWLRFSRLVWQGRPIAFHRGTCYEGHYKYGRAAFSIEFAHSSPGTVLLRHLLLAAIEEGAHTFDFGLGDEAYKYRYATDVVNLQTWGLYPEPDRHQPTTEYQESTRLPGMKGRS